MVGMDVMREVIKTVDDVLSLKGRGASFSSATPLLGAIAEFDSMAVLSLISAIEERFGIVVQDDEIDGATFATIGTLTDFVAGKLSADEPLR